MTLLFDYQADFNLDHRIPAVVFSQTNKLSQFCSYLLISNRYQNQFRMKFFAKTTSTGLFFLLKFILQIVVEIDKIWYLEIDIPNKCLHNIS